MLADQGREQEDNVPRQVSNEEGSSRADARHDPPIALCQRSQERRLASPRWADEFHDP
jgi:hypothetical protein